MSLIISLVETLSMTTPLIYECFISIIIFSGIFIYLLNVACKKLDLFMNNNDDC